MGAFYLDERIEALVRQIAQANSRSPQQREAAENTGLAVARALTEMAVEQSILPNIRAEVRALQAELRGDIRAARDAKDALGAALCPDKLEERAVAVVALTSALLTAYADGLTCAHPRSEPLTAQNRTQIARAVSYTVWAYLTGGAIPPPEDPGAGGEG